MSEELPDCVPVRDVVTLAEIDCDCVRVDVCLCESVDVSDGF